MQEAADMQLLREYVQQNSQEAFAALVSRHLALVYSVAWRKTGSPEAAEEVTQTVFILLAKKAARLGSGTVLSGWLYQAARLTAARFLRTEFRRVRREQEAGMQSFSNETESSLWPQIAPMLDDAMGKLSEKERDSIALRFFEGKSFQEIGTEVGASENAAKKRVGHALEKLRAYLSKRGVVSTAAIIEGAISGHAVQTAPVALATPVVAAALAKGATAGASTLALVNGVLTMMAWTRARTAAVAGAAVLVTAGTGVLATKAIQAARAAYDSELGTRVQELEARQRLVSREIQWLERERNQAANRLAMAARENALLRSGPGQAELLKLRSMVGVLKQELAANEALGRLSSKGLLSQLEEDPAMKNAMRQKLQQQAQSDYGDLFKELKLTPEQTAKVVELIADRGMKTVDRLNGLAPGAASSKEITQAVGAPLADLWKQLEPLLGENGVARLKEAREELPARTTVELLNGRLGAGHLNDEEGAHLVQIVKAEPFDLTSGVVLTDPGMLGAQDAIDDHLLKITASNQHILQQAGSFLTPEQLSALSVVLSNGISYRILTASLFSGKH
jgi:RNA polymerase sigma factor (sigma-70 family)